MGDFTWRGGHLAETQRETSDVSAGPSCCWGRLGGKKGRGPSLIHVVPRWLEAAGRSQYR